MPVAQPLPAAHNPRSRFSLAVAIVGLAGVASIFLPFTYDVSPFGAARTLFSGDSFLGDLWHLGIPSLLAILVTAGAFRLAVSGRLTRGERLVGYLAALGAGCCFLAIYLPDGNGDSAWGPSTVSEWCMLLTSWVGSAAGAYLLWRNRRRGVPDAANVIVAMQIAYAITAVFSLIAFPFNGWQVGAYLVALTTLAYLAQIAAVSVAAPRHPAPAVK
jgi:hypothetical protein